MRLKPGHRAACHSLKVRAAVSLLALLAATVACDARAGSEDNGSDDTNNVSHPLATLRVALTNVHPQTTARASIVYTFAIKKVLPIDSRATEKDLYSQGTMQFTLWEGADQDDKKRDSIIRLTEFFGLPASGSKIPMALEDTNAVTLRTFSRGGMLFEDDRGNRAAVSPSPSEAWTSRALWERFGGWRSDEEKTNSESDESLRQRLIGVWTPGPNTTLTLLGNGTFIEGYTNAKMAGAYEGVWLVTNGFMVSRTTNHLDERHGAWWRPPFFRCKILRIDDREFFALTELPSTNHLFRYRPDLKW